MLNYRSVLVAIPFVFCTLASAATVQANGGPVGGTTVTGSGGVAPVRQEQIRLVSEDLEIRMNDDLDTYHVTAYYVLSNPGPETEVLFGVPVTWSTTAIHFDDLEEYMTVPGPDMAGWRRARYPRWAEEAATELDRIRANIQIRLGDTAFSCEMRNDLQALESQEEGTGEEAAPSPGNRPRRLDWDGWLDIIIPDEPTEFQQDQIDHLAEYPMEIQPIRAWCVAPMVIPPGDSIELTLSYDGALWFSDLLWSKGIYTDHSLRLLSYLLFPAGYWAGRVERLNIRVDLGPHSDYLVFSPPGKQRVDDSLVWSLTDVDLSELSQLVITFRTGRFLHVREIARWNRTNPHGTNFRLQASATSERAAEPDREFAAANVIDGDEHTAWCEGVDGAGVGESLTLTFALPEGMAGFDSYCRVHGIALGYGDTRDATTYGATNRVRRLTVFPCDQEVPLGSLVLRNEPATDHRLAFTEGLRFVDDPRDRRDDEEEEGSGSVVQTVSLDELFERFRLPSSHRRSQPAVAEDQPPPELCLRFAIEEVVEGTNGHTCISEIIPLVGCQ